MPIHGTERYRTMNTVLRTNSNEYIWLEILSDFLGRRLDEFVNVIVGEMKVFGFSRHLEIYMSFEGETEMDGREEALRSVWSRGVFSETKHLLQIVFSDIGDINH